jgi:hypothetical protein
MRYVEAFFLRLYIYFLLCVYALCNIEGSFTNYESVGTRPAVYGFFLPVHLMDLQMVETIIVIIKTRHDKFAALADWLLYFTVPAKPASRICVYRKPAEAATAGK